jgi:SP family general alpha glucoside:H+ symporter-like MFS transporter
MSHNAGEKTTIEQRTHQVDFEEAKQAAEEEHQLTLLQAIRQHPKAIIWSVLLSTSIIMEGYDIVLMNSFFAQPAFSQKYGTFDARTDKYQVSRCCPNCVGDITDIVSPGL